MARHRHLHFNFAPRAFAVIAFFARAGFSVRSKVLLVTDYAM